jgi:hypothetical protein
MDEIGIAFARLTGLCSTVQKRLVRIDYEYFDPLTVIEYFERYAMLRDKLRTLLPDLYSDIPTRAIPVASKTTDNEGRGYITRGPLETLIRDMEEFLEIWEANKSGQFALPSMKVTREGVFFAGQYFDALLRVNEILSQAKLNIVIIDGYVNENVLNILSGKANGVVVNILTKNTSPALIAAANAFNMQYGNLSIRTSSAFHDRFVIVDERDFYHFGASIKDLGNRGFMFSLIEEPIVINSLRMQWPQDWAKAAVVI